MVSGAHWSSSPGPKPCGWRPHQEDLATVCRPAGGSAAKGAFLVCLEKNFNCRNFCRAKRHKHAERGPRLLPFPAWDRLSEGKPHSQGTPRTLPPAPAMGTSGPPGRWSQLWRPCLQGWPLLPQYHTSLPAARPSWKERNTENSFSVPPHRGHLAERLGCQGSSPGSPPAAFPDEVPRKQQGWLRQSRSRHSQETHTGFPPLGSLGLAQLPGVGAPSKWECSLSFTLSNK